MKVVYIESKKYYVVHLKPFEAYELVGEFYGTKDREFQDSAHDVALNSIYAVPKYRILYNDVPISLDKSRFITQKEHRKLKLEKISKNNEQR